MTRESKSEKRITQKVRVVFFATDNFHKFKEARKLLKKTVTMGMLRVKGPEIQSNSLIEIAKNSALETFNRCCLPIVVEDAGLFIDELNGFPGPYAAYTYKTIGNKGLIQLMKNSKSKKAQFKSVVAYLDSTTKDPAIFEGEAEGEITNNEPTECTRSGFGFDPIFSPFGSIKTFAQMSIEEKNNFSHRAKAFSKFAKWYRNNK